MFSKKLMFSVAAATLLSSGALMAQDTAAPAAEATVHCGGVTSCKGSSDCKTADNACKGQNTCKGHGFKVMTAEECAAAGGKAEEA